MSSSSVWADSVSHVRVVDDDIVAVRNLGVGNETEKGSDDMDMGGAYQIFWGVRYFSINSQDAYDDDCADTRRRGEDFQVEWKIALSTTVMNMEAMEFAESSNTANNLRPAPLCSPATQVNDLGRNAQLLCYPKLELLQQANQMRFLPFQRVWRCSPNSESFGVEKSSSAALGPDCLSCLAYIVKTTQYMIVSSRYRTSLRFSNTRSLPVDLGSFMLLPMQANYSEVKQRLLNDNVLV
ncbi:hypothetical protein EDD18DRAFT_1352836 [Armillaria luteobubalina]|uniref:Uncharacterized protein n=1 Tax=Armillaria luteobubalina TaxID=153913 RepID=A0AA39Q7X5_9AGAR|nr:hypothetical protein EDD18DRAFT_1352836 [Armillaria luteobubalina]